MTLHTTVCARHARRTSFLGRACLALPLFLTTGMARANVGPPSSGGQVVLEPVGIKNVEITRESLTIDLRPLAQNGHAHVEALYRLHNRSIEKKLDLLFASGSASVANFRVWLGDQPVTSRPDKDARLPSRWRVPKQTPGLNGGQPLDYLEYDEVKPAAPLALTVVIPPGQHTLKVRYEAEAATHFFGEPIVYRQFAYVLAPARSWAGFGGLDVTIHLPQGWRAACTPALARHGDTLRGTFDHLPADAIALTVQAPSGWAYQIVSYGSLGLLALTVLAGTVLCWRVGRANGRSLANPAALQSNWLKRHAWPSSLAMSFAWGLVILGVGLLAIFGPDWVLPAGVANHYGYGQALAALGVILVSVLAVPTGFTIAQLAAVTPPRGTAARSSRASVPPATDAKPGVQAPEGFVHGKST
jgi:hypothetical protein